MSINPEQQLKLKILRAIIEAGTSPRDAFAQRSGALRKSRGQEEEVAMKRITLSRQLGSLGDEVIQELSQELELQILDKHTLTPTFQQAGLEGGTMERFDERKPGFWDNFRSEKDTYLHYLKQAIYDFAQSGSCLIIGRGGNILLSDVPGILRIRLVASMDNRIQRVMNRYRVGEKEAERLINHSDDDRTGFYRYFFYSEWGAPEHYDLVLNTDTLGLESLLAIIRQALNSKAHPSLMAEADHRLKDLALAHRVLTKVLYEAMLPIDFLEAVASDGVVTLRGASAVAANIDRAGEEALKVEGVREVINQISHLHLADTIIG